MRTIIDRQRTAVLAARNRIHEQLPDYATTKGAIHGFTKSLAQNLVERGIRVNCVVPGPVWTPLNPSDKPAHEVAHFGEKTPMKRPAQPEEIAPAFVFFASEADSSYITGGSWMIVFEFYCPLLPLLCGSPAPPYWPMRRFTSWSVGSPAAAATDWGNSEVFAFRVRFFADRLLTVLPLFLGGMENPFTHSEFVAHDRSCAGAARIEV